MSYLSSLDSEVINYSGYVLSSVYWEGVSRLLPEVESDALFNTFFVCVSVCMFVYLSVETQDLGCLP